MPGPQGQGIDPLKAWEMTRWCGEVIEVRPQDAAARFGPPFAGDGTA